MGTHSFGAHGIGKKFYRNWVFRNISFQLEQGQRLLLTGPNGSGKSTLIRILAGQMAPTEGKTHFTAGKRLLDYESYYSQLSWAAPWQDLYNDLTLTEAIHLHFQFKLPIIPQNQIAQALELEKHLSKPLRHFSSGMLHRTKTGLAIFSKSRLLILDEATTNMDQVNSDLVFRWLDEYLGDRMLIFASNNPAEFERFDRRLDLGNPPPTATRPITNPAKETYPS